MMALEEIKSYLMEELKEERQKRIMGQENHYSYLFMICNDIGIVVETEEQKKE